MTADQVITALFYAGIAVSVGATVLSLGVTFTVAQLIAPLHRLGLVLGMVVVNALVIPAVAWGIAEVSPMPVWAGQVVTGAAISAGDIVKSLLALVLIPLVVGLFMRFRYTEHAIDWQMSLVKLANLALVIALSAGIAGNWSTIKTMFGSWVIVTALVIVAVAGALGVLTGLVGGTRSAEVVTTTGLVSTFRFGSLGLRRTLWMVAQSVVQHWCSARIARSPTRHFTPFPG